MQINVPRLADAHRGAAEKYTSSSKCHGLQLQQKPDSDPFILD